MEWKKKGLIFNVDGCFDWNKSHAQTPVVDMINDRYRIYYSTRDSKGRANISFIEVCRTNPKKILYIHDDVLFKFGNIGTFDDSGVMPTCIVTAGNYKYLYYIGWTTRKTVPYHNSIGLAISEDNGHTFRKISDGPIISCNHIEPYFSGTCFVLNEGGLYKMWYLSCIKWIVIADRKEPIYNIKYSESIDGINWKQTGEVAIELNKSEGGIASASVIKKQERYLMWYSYRGMNNYRHEKDESYKIGFAESYDGKSWERKDDLAGIRLSDAGWDSEMMCYPYVLNDNGMIMFYNGNGFGKSGFGYATYE